MVCKPLHLELVHHIRGTSCPDAAQSPQVRLVWPPFRLHFRNLDLSHTDGWSYDQRIEKSNGRIVTRSVTVNHRLDWMDTGIRGKWRNRRSLRKKHRRAMLDLNYRNSLLSLA